jgi:long-chain acyl-CoA synthetase
MFEGIRKKTVNSISLFISGGAALTKDVAIFFNIMGTVIVEGYGITECSPVVSCNLPDDRDVGTVGPPLKGVDVKISQSGELLVKGPTVMTGYYNKPEQTAAVFDNEGWFKTGDIAAWTDNGKIKILGRLKDIIVMANGKNISPQKIESRLKSTGYIENACIAGDEKKYLSAIIVPDFEALSDYAKTHEIHFTNEKDLIAHPVVTAMIRKDVFEVNKTLEPHEAIKRYHIMDEKFTVESGELTPTLKIKRGLVLKKYKSIFNSLYSEK